MSFIKAGKIHLQPAPFISATLAGVILFMARMKGPEGILLFDRFVPGLGMFQLTLIALYSGVVSHLLLTRKDTAKIRLRIWNLFSLVFFSQLFIGIFVSRTFLMSGTLHIPVPALILAGPIFDGSGFFMPILFTTTILLIGPAWCSHLCYFGSWDGLAASTAPAPDSLGTKWRTLRWTVFFIVILASVIFRLFHASTTLAVTAALIFGLTGMLLMLTLSRKKGVMIHCTSYCPIGLLGNILGKLSPFRIKIDASCLFCMQCTEACRYNALKVEDMKAGKAGFTCTLCGDCISACSRNSISYSFLRLSPEKSRTLFIVLIAALHSAFLGIARI